MVHIDKLKQIAKPRNKAAQRKFLRITNLENKIMKLTIKQEVNTDGWFLYAFLGLIAEWWDEEPFVFNGKEYTDINEFEKDYPQLVDFQPPYYRSDPKEGTKTIKLCIDLDSGKVLNWPEGVNFDFNCIKLVDTGRYEIRDNKNKFLTGHTGYVPICFSIDDVGYGDYLQFRIEDNKICDWNFDQEDYDDFVVE